MNIVNSETSGMYGGTKGECKNFYAYFYDRQGYIFLDAIYQPPNHKILVVAQVFSAPISENPSEDYPEFSLEF